jgi:hypothetical protein
MDYQPYQITDKDYVWVRIAFRFEEFASLHKANPDVLDPARGSVIFVPADIDLGRGWQRLVID